MPSIRSVAAASAAALVGLGLTACGSSGPGGNPAASKASDGLALAQCMRAHGVPNFPDPGSNGRGGLQIQQSRRSGSGPSLNINGVAVSSPAFQSAMQSCRKYLPNGGRPPPLTAARKQAMLRFSQCMRTHGITNFPDPSFGADGGVGIRFGSSSGINPNSPVFQAAQKACAPAGGGFAFKTVGPPPPG